MRYEPLIPEGLVYNQAKAAKIIAEFTLGRDRLAMIAADFRHDLVRGLRGEADSSMRMLKSYIALPTGKERGDYIAVDFGGSNIRVLLYRLHGDGEYELLRKIARPLQSSETNNSYDYSGTTGSAEELFTFIANLIGELIATEPADREYLLGHTFSFPTEQHSLADARLITWTKEIATRGVEGEYVNRLLAEALERQHIKRVRPVAIINDTVAVLLSAAYQHGNTYIGSIYATGYNTCYLEPFGGQACSPMILNLEAGHFSKLTPNYIDSLLDRRSEKPNEQRLEKMVSGRYLGELLELSLRLITDQLSVEHNQSPLDIAITSRLDTVAMGKIIEDTSAECEIIREILRQKLGYELTASEAASVREVARAIVTRSARLVAASYVGIIWQLAGNNPVREQSIVIDGSLYANMPLIKQSLTWALGELLGEDSDKVTLRLDNEGSGLGGAIAAAMSAGVPTGIS